MLPSMTDPSTSKVVESWRGSESVVADIESTKLGLTICYDLRFPELYRTLALAGAEILAVPSNFTERTGRDHWEVLLRARAIENGAWVIAPSQIGGPPGQPAYGHTMVVDPWGIVVAQAPDREAIVHAVIDTDRDGRSGASPGPRKPSAGDVPFGLRLPLLGQPDEVGRERAARGDHAARSCRQFRGGALTDRQR